MISQLCSGKADLEAALLGVCLHSNDLILSGTASPRLALTGPIMEPVAASGIREEHPFRFVFRFDADERQNGIARHHTAAHDDLFDQLAAT